MINCRVPWLIGRRNVLANRKRDRFVGSHLWRPAKFLNFGDGIIKRGNIADPATGPPV